MPKHNFPAEKLNDIPIDQAPVIPGDSNEHESIIVVADKNTSKDYLDRLAFMEEPVTIRLEPAAEKNAPAWFPASVNGEGAEVLQPDGTWMHMREGYLPVGRRITTKRKYVEVLLRAKIDTINIEGTSGYDVDRGTANAIRRMTTPVHGISIIEDKNPRSQGWYEEMRRRYL